MNRERILDLADIIENDRLPNVEFDMNYWMDNLSIGPACGTTACIAGYTVIAAHGVNAGNYCAPTEAQRILSLTDTERYELFSGSYYAPKDQAVRTLRKFAETGRVDWRA